MKCASALLSLALASFSAISAAQPHGKLYARHGHGHLRPRYIATEYATTTVVKYGAAPTVAPAPPPPSPPANDDEGAEEEEEDADKPVAPAADDDEGASTGSTGGYDGIEKEFPDGELSCSEFPSKYGALKTEWITKDGWSGIQRMEKQYSGEVRLANGDGAGKCLDGYWCSYACPPGYSKAQWPEDEQPSNGESVGGLKCKNGKLHLTRPSKSKKLCEKGSGVVDIVSKLGKGVAVCRTDYPGTEKMSIPTWVEGGKSIAMTVPFASKSYRWQNKPTTAQYYVNDAGVSKEDGCVWGQPGGGKGNWAPMVFGAGTNENGETFLSIFQNPETPNKLNFNVKIDTGNEAGSCKYENGKFSGPGASANGCTAACTKKATYVFY